jgi:hypothetical protein
VLVERRELVWANVSSRRTERVVRVCHGFGKLV